MTTTKIDMSPERQLITQLILSVKFAQEILPLLNPRHLKTRYAQIVASWVSEYFDKFQDVPGMAIQDIYIQKRKGIANEDEATSVAEFLQNLSDSLKEEKNVEYYIDSTIQYLKSRSLEAAIAEMHKAIDVGDVSNAENVIANYKRIGRPEGDGYSLIDNPQDIIQAFTEEAEVALRFPGGVGEVVGPCRRGDLISFIAPVKRGKTWALLAAAEYGFLQGQRVTFVTLEMPKAQILRRAWQSFLGKPKLDGTITMPYFAPNKEADEEITDKTEWRIEYKDVFKKGVDLDEVEHDQTLIKKLYRDGDCRFIPMASKATTVKDIEMALDNLRYYNQYETDILVIDYADLLGAKANEYRHQLDDIWSNLRRVAQERNILIITATQTNRAGLSGEDITPENVAEDMRKLAHVSKLIALNQTAAEKQSQYMRWKLLLDRDEMSTYDEALVLTCLKCGKFILDSRLKGQMG